MILIFFLKIRNPDCLAFLAIDGCELGLRSTGPGRIISTNSEKRNIMIRLDAFERFVDGMFNTYLNC